MLSYFSKFATLFAFALLSASVWGQPNFSLTGFATQNGGTTGGAGETTVTVRSFAELQREAESDERKIILIEGTISNGSTGGRIRVRSNKSLLGVGSSAFLNGIALNITNHNNIIVRNLKMTLVGTSNPSGVNGGDVISINGTSRNIWIDHCELYSEDPDVQTNLDKYDGLLDIRDQTGFITISWNHFHNHHKGCLVGASESDLYADRKVTYHHNYFRKVRLRVPMYRGSTGHFFNNYIVGARDASEIRNGACVRVERNYYEALHYSIYTPNDYKGKTERINNVEVSRTSRAYPENCVASIPYSYSAVLTSNTQDVKTLVPQWAGVGKVNVAGASSSSSVAVSSSAAVSSSSQGEATLTKRGAGSSRQTLVQGEALVAFWYSWENANTVQVQGMPAGISVDIDNAARSVSFAGTPTAPVGVYNFTVTTVGGANTASIGGAITIEGTTGVLRNPAPSSVGNTAGSVRWFDLVGRRNFDREN